MALGQTLRLELEDGSAVEATYDGRDIRAWETKTGKSALGVPLSLSMLTYFGWSAAKRTGALNGSYAKWDEFDQVCVAVTGPRVEEDQEEDQEEDLDPTQAPADTPQEAWAG